MKKAHQLAALLFPALLGQVASGQLLITQYYEGPSNNKYIELTNVGSESLDLATYTLTRWSNAATEDWKGAGPIPTGEVTLSGTLSAGVSFVVANGSAAIPLLAADADLTSGVITFNEDDSVVLYNGLDGENLPIFDPANIVDAVSFTDLGAEGKDLSIVRQNLLPGYNTTVGSTFLDFPAVWQVVTLEDVAAATLGENLYLGSSVLGTSAPIVTFTAGSTVKREDSTSVELTIQLLNPDAEAVTVDVGFDALGSTATTSDIANYTTQTVTFPAGSPNGATQTVTVTLTDDSDAESSEEAIFLLENLQTAGDAIIGGNASFTLTIQDDDTVIPGIYISEIADPADVFEARFVEIHNPTASEVNLDTGNWTLVVYFNANSSGQEIPLSGLIPAGGVFVIARDEAAYLEGYPGAPVANQYDDTINSNGDDNLALYFGGGQNTGTLVDLYGIPGTDGTGLEHEFENSQVVRNVSVPNATFTFGEWVITPNADRSAMSPGTIGPVDPPGPTELWVTDFSMDRSTGAGSLTVTGLGVQILVVESSTDLGQSDAWAPLANPAAEVDNPDGSVSFNFTDAEAVGEGKIFYRLNEAP
ncbi:lamin tail domain-containing protein [Akkermansiaceae bacterium]|nr:lamin tail domain-containing protein [Akkermansiaceae bacterium]